MSSIKFSIVVPTRNRFDTLKYCLLTCLQQGSFNSYEIIVSDNSDEPESKDTKRTVDELHDFKIKYFRPPAVLSMTANFEFALSKCTGEYVLSIGDDDGILPECLTYVNELITRYDTVVVKSPVIVYHWKNALQNPNTLTLPYPTPVTRVDSRSILQKVARFELGYFNLPMIYYAFVKKQIVDEVIARQGSFFGNAAAVDLYSGLVIAHSTTDFLVSDKPFVIAGLSGKSNGSSVEKSLQNKVSQDWYQKTGLHEMYKMYQVPQLPAYNLQLLSLLELVKFRKNFGLSNEQLPVNLKKVMVKLLSGTPVMDNIESLGSGACFEEYDMYKNDIDEVKNDFFRKKLFFPFLGNNDIQTISHVKVNPDLFSIENVFDAAIVLKKILDGYENVKPVPITIDKKATANHNYTPLHFLKTGYRRLKLATKILLVGHG